MPFTSADVQYLGSVSDTTALAYSVLRDGEHVGVVHVAAAAGLISSGEDVSAWIAERLNAAETSEGYDKLAQDLEATLDL